MFRWTHNATEQTHSCTKDGYHAVVWRTTTDEWVVILSHHQRAIAHIQCATLPDAQQWCEARLAALAKEDRHADP